MKYFEEQVGGTHISLFFNIHKSMELLLCSTRISKKFIELVYIEEIGQIWKIFEE